MYAAVVEEQEVHAQGRAPTAEGIRRQKAEQVEATLILRGILGVSHMTVTPQQKGYMRRLSRARGLPTK
jgi:hypothetical protein